MRRHRLAAQLLLLTLLLPAAGRLRGGSPPLLPPCRHPVGLERAERIDIRCLSAHRSSWAEVLAGTPCTASGWIRSGELLRLGPGCAVTRGLLPGSMRLVLGLPLDLNRATRAELVLLPRIGPVLAGRLIEERQRRGGFTAIEDILQVRGIGRVTLDLLRPLIAVNPMQPPGQP